MIIAQLSIAPVGVDISLSDYIQIVLDTLKKEKIKFNTNPMSTILEVEDLSHLLSVVQKAHDAVKKTGVKRIITELKIDDRFDKVTTMKKKLESLDFS